MTTLELWKNMAQTVSLIPLEPGTKRPKRGLKGWEVWSHKLRPFNSDEFVDQRTGRVLNAGIVTGKSSNRLVLDCDCPSAFALACQVNGWKIPDTEVVISGGGNCGHKCHYHFSYPTNGKTYGNKSFKRVEGFDLRGVGGYVVAHGSIHPETGKPYKIQPGGALCPPPSWLLNLYQEDEEPPAPPIMEIPLEDQEIIDRAMDAINGASFSALWGGDISAYPSHSEADQALCNHLAFWCGNDFDRIDRLFRQSGLYRKKWDREDYRKRTIMKAINSTTEVYGSRVEVEAEREAIQEEAAEAEQAHQQQDPLDFPSWVMTGAAGRFAFAYSEYLEVPTSFLFMGFLTVLGNIISGWVTLRSELQPQTRLYTVLLGQSADERKSTAISKVADFFRAEIEVGGLNACYGVGSAEGLAKKMEETPGLVLLVDELKTFVQKAKIEGAVLLPCVNTLFESNRFHSATKKHNIAIDDAHLSLLTASTVETYATMFNSTFLDIGFINRLFLVLGHAEKRFAIPRVVPESVKKELGGELQLSLAVAGALRQQAEPYPMPIHPEAERAFEHWYFNTPRSVFTKRLDAYGHRLMPLIAINDRRRDIDLEVVEKVIALLDYELAVRREADPIDADNRIAALEERIRRVVTNGPIRKRDLERKVNKTRVGRWAWKRAIANLVEDHEITWNRKENRYEV